MANLTKFFRGESVFSSMFRQKLNAIVDWINSQNQDEIARTPQEESEGKDESRTLWIRIDGHSDGQNRTWLYEWTEVVVNSDGQSWYEPAIRSDFDTWFDESHNITLGLAVNGAEHCGEEGVTFASPEDLPIPDGSATVHMPIRNGTIVKAKIEVYFAENPEDPEGPYIKYPRVSFSASNTERYFFAEITGFSGGYYSWSECYADGTAISVTDSPQSGSGAVNSYYGPSDLTHVVSNGRVVMMEYLPSETDPNLVGFCVPVDGENLPMVGDEMGYPAPATIPEIYPPYTPADNPVQIGGDGAWIEVWEVDDPASVTDPKERIRRIYHLEPSTAAADQEFNTCLAEVTDGGNPDGGGAGKIEFEDILVEPDAMGHVYSAEPELTPSSLAAGAGLVINGSLKTGTIKHSNPGAAVNTYAMDATSITGGASITFVTIPFDTLGHFVNASSTTTNIDFIGDEWIDFALGGIGGIFVTHQPAQSDGALGIAGSVITISAGSISWKMFNSYIDSKGHVKLGSSSTAEATLTAGNKISISGAGSSATIAYVDASAGTPASAGDVFVGGSLLVSGTNIVFRPRVKPLMVTTNSYGQVTAVTLGTETDGTDITLAAGEC